jgi:hypothetical protein
MFDQYAKAPGTCQLIAITVMVAIRQSLLR